MRSAENSSNSIVEGVIWKRILAFFFPIMLGSLFQQLYNTVDTIVVGQFEGKAALAAVGGSASQILNLITGFFVGLSSGATVIVSQFYGAHEPKGVSRAVHTAVSLTLVGGFLMMVLGLVMAPTMLRWMNTPEETMADSALYLRIVFLSMIPNMLFNVGSGIQRAVGDSKRPLYFLMICCAVNILLDLLFVAAMGMGVKGVAFATAISQTVSAVLVCVSLHQTKDCYQFELRKLCMDRALLLRTVQIGIPAGLQSVMYGLSNMIITTTINSFGTSTVAAWVVLGRVDGVYWLILSAYGVAMTTFVGQNYGARRFDRVRKSVRVCILLSLITSWLFSLLLILFGQYAFRLFTSEADVLKVTMEMMLYLAPWYWIFVPIEMYSGALRGMGDTLIPTLITAVGICVFRVTWMLAVVPHWHAIRSIMISYPISWLMTSIAFIFYYKARKKLLLPGVY